MKTRTVIGLLLVLAIFYTSCKKDIDAQWGGNYMATVRYRLYDYPDTITPVKDTTYKMVLLTVGKSAGSSRKNAAVDVTLYSAYVNLSSMNNLPVSDGKINYSTSDSAQAFVRTWTGNFTNDSLNLSYREEDTLMYVSDWDIKAVKK